MVCGRNDWRTTEDCHDLALAGGEYGIGNGRWESLHSGWAYRLSLRLQQERRADSPVCHRRGRRRVRRRADGDWSQATIAIPMDRPDELMGLPSIPDGLPHRPHGTTQSGLTDELVRPDLFTELVLGHKTITMF
jgi:hypothetical protein